MSKSIEYTANEKVVLAQKKMQELYNRVQAIYQTISDNDEKYSEDADRLWNKSQRLRKAQNKLAVFSDQLLCKHVPNYLGCDGDTKDLFFCESCGTLIFITCPDIVRARVHSEYDIEILTMVTA